MTTTRLIPSRSGAWLAAWITLTATLLMWVCTWTGPGQPSALPALLVVLGKSLPLVLGWLLAAIGLGGVIRRLLFRDAQAGLPLQVGVGLAAMLLLDAALGPTGALQWEGRIGAWLALTPGWIALIAQILRQPRTDTALQGTPFGLATSPSIAVLVVAACSAPGWLWATEFGGYDALSYHLQLPKEWLALGYVAPLDHNVYSYLPGAMEAAYYHLAAMRGDALEASYACQVLHAAFSLVTAWSLQAAAQGLFGESRGGASSALVLATPWVIVTGSLAYDEMAVCLCLTTGITLLVEPTITPTARGVLLGLAAGASTMAKLTAVGMVVLPLGVAGLMFLPRRQWLAVGFAGALMFAACLLPWLVRNFAANGNPLFPFGTAWFGYGHWSQAQTLIWNRAHFTEAGLLDRVKELANQWLRFGIGPNPATEEPWKPQWSVLPWLAIGGVLVWLTKPSRSMAAGRLTIMLAIQLVFWLGFTHLKSRFLLPTVVPSALLGVWLLEPVITRMKPAAITAALLLMATANLWIFHAERPGAPAFAVGQVGSFTGDDLPSEARLEAGLHYMPAVAVNHLLPHDAKVLLIGDARPLYFRRPVVYQTTWDRGPLSAVMRRHPEQPGAWAAALHARGFTHVLMDEAMLERWERSGWNDPLLTRTQVRRFAEDELQLFAEYPAGVSLWSIRSK